MIQFKLVSFRMSASATEHKSEVNATVSDGTAQITFSGEGKDDFTGFRFSVTRENEWSDRLTVPAFGFALRELQIKDATLL